METASFVEPGVGRYRASRTEVALAVGVAGLIASSLTAWACANSPILVDPTGTALWRSAFVASYVAVGTYSWWRRPESRLGPLVAAVGFLYTAASLNASGAALAYTLGMVVWVAVIVYLAYVYLCFPRGRLESAIERGFVLALVLSTGVVWGLILVLSPTLPLGGAFNDCGARCPPNALQIFPGHADVAAALNAAFNVVTTISLIGIAMLIFNKARSSAYITRRAMAPLTVAFIANIVEFVLFLFVGAAYPGTRDAFRIADGVVTVAVPFAMLAGQFRSHAFAARSLGQFWLRASAEPMTPGAVQDVIGDALGDPTLRVAVWDPESATYVGVGGDPVALPRDGGERGVTYVSRDGWPVAALIHDRALQTDSDIVEALAATSLTLLENWRLVEELRTSRSRLIKAAELERRRLERDLHDGAQQRLVAIQVKVAMAQQATDPQDRERQLGAIEREAEAAVKQLRRLAHGIYPPELHDFGLTVALRALADGSPVPIRVSTTGIGRYPDEIEAAIYYSASEAIQNAAKHAGPGANVAISLVARQDAIELRVDDDGAGMAHDHAKKGIGIIGMRDRVEAVGGSFEMISASGRGTSISATVPHRARQG